MLSLSRQKACILLTKVLKCFIIKGVNCQKKEKGVSSMKFIALQPEAEAADKTALEQEYEHAEDFAPARIGDTRFFFKVGRKVWYLPLASITRVFRRVELVNARMGCCNQGLPMESVVVCGADEQELAQIRLATERMGKALLAALKKACPNAKVGYERPEGQETAVRSV